MSQHDEVTGHGLALGGTAGFCGSPLSRELAEDKRCGRSDIVGDTGPNDWQSTFLTGGSAEMWQLRNVLYLA